MTPRQPFNSDQLTEREALILQLVVKSFIETAGPVASRFLSLRYDLGLSSASIRNTMNDLESKGFLGHPHTSAGRVPTDQGYRAFVDSLMEKAVLKSSERHLMKSHLLALQEDTDALLTESSHVLARLARLLGVVLSPQLSSGILERLEIVQVASDRVMFVLSVEGGLLRTIVLNVVTGLDRFQMDRLVELLNERLAGLSLDEIRRTCADRMMDLRDDQTGIVQLILNDSDTLFSEDPDTRALAVDGATYILEQPEFDEKESMRGIITLLDDRSQIRRLVTRKEVSGKVSPAHASVFIGHEATSETDEGNVRNLSIVTAPYRRSNMTGTIGVIGPKRMNYARIIALVEGMAMLMSWPAAPEKGSNEA